VRVTPVEQRILYDPANPAVRGDCWKCCIASILNLDYDNVPHFVQDWKDSAGYSWWEATVAWLTPRGFNIAWFPLAGGTRPRLCQGPLFEPAGHWIAKVTSARGNDHAVVMRGDQIAWDPHPDRGLAHNGFLEAHLLVAA
jgi:hypothetical protein